MFEFVRTHQRLMQFLLLLLIIPSFAFVGLGSYTRFRDDGNAVAKVAGQTISQQEWDAALREQMDRLRQMYGARFDPKLFDTPESRQNIMDELIAKRVLNAEAANAHLTVPDQVLQKAIVSISGLTTKEGKFDRERYISLLALQGQTEASYESRLRKDMAMQQLNGAIQSTAFAPKTLAAHLSDLSEQERDVQELPFKLADFAAQAKVTDDMLKAYYDKNSVQFEIPEQVKAEYVVLTRDTVEEQRRASHILVKVEKGASDADKAAAKAKAEKLLAQARKNPSDFARLAKENSQDTASAELGGDLDFFGKGMMTRPFEEATYKLKQGEISDVIETEFGYHIIQLTGVKPNVAALMDAKKFSEMAETFSNTVYEQADSLKPAADKLSLKIETASSLTRQPNAALSPKLPYNNEKFLKALFSDEAIKNKHNTEAVEVAPNILVAGHVVEYKPATQRPFEEVKAMVRERVMQIETAKLAKQAGEAKLAALKAKDDAAGFSGVTTVSRTKKDVPSAEFIAVMKADVRKLPAYVGTEMLDKSYSVFRISKVAQPEKPDEARRQAEQQQVADALAQQEMIAYIEVLKQKNKTKILKPVVTAEAPAEAGTQSSSQSSANK